MIKNEDLNFQNHTNSIIKTDKQTLSARIRVASFTTYLNKKVMFNSFISG